MSRLMALSLRGSEHPERYSAATVFQGGSAASPAGVAVPKMNLFTAGIGYKAGNFDEQKHPRGGRSENKGEFSSQPGMGAVPKAPAAATPAPAAAAPADHAARHQFTKAALSQIEHPSVRGVMSALHAHPDVASGGATATEHFAPEHGRQAYDWMRQNAGKTTGGGQVVDLGKGRMGFASAAGSIIVTPPVGRSAAWQVKYTHNTGVVQRAMGKPAVPQPSAGPPAAPPGSGPPQPTPPRTAPPVQGGTQEPFLREPPVITEPPQFQMGAQGRAMTPEAGQAASALMGSQQQPAAPASPSAPQSPRDLANASRDRLAAATQQWQQELGSGLTPKGNARWRSYLTALRSIHHDQEHLARTHEQQQKVAAKSQGKATAGGSSSSDPEFAKMEAAVHQHDPHALEQIRQFSAGKAEGYRNLVQQYHDSLFPKSVTKRGNQPLFEKPEETPEVPPGAVSPLGQREREAMGRLGIGGAGQASKPLGTAEERLSRRDKERQMREEARTKGFSVRPPPKSPAPSARPQFGSGMHAWGDSPEQIAKNNPPEEHGRGLLAPEQSAVATAPKAPAAAVSPLEGSPKWKAFVRKKASEWDMKPHEFAQLADDLHKELSSHQGEQKAAYLTARKASGLAPADINKLENSGFDYGSEHPKIKQLDTIGRELAANYPGLGWGRGREEEGGDEGNIDYAAKVWDLLKGGYKPPPSKTSSAFIEHVEDFLRHQLKHAGSSGVAGGHAAEGDDLSAVPFSLVLSGEAVVEKYREWLAERMR